MESLQETPRPSRLKALFENFASLFLAILLVLVIRSSVIEAFKIPSGSMIPTLLIGDHIFVNKFAYGIKIPFSDLVLDHPLYVIDRAPPQRGDIIVFMYPKDESVYYIKRIVGVAGDTIEVRNKVLYVNGKIMARDAMTGAEADKIFKSLDDPKYTSSTLDLFKEHLEGVDHWVMQDKNSFTGENFGPTTVAPDSLFVMGDNRDFSNDSRFWGFVPLRNVKGKAFIIWLSVWPNWADSQFFWHPERIGTLLH